MLNKYVIQFLSNRSPSKLNALSFPIIIHNFTIFRQLQAYSIAGTSIPIILYKIIIHLNGFFPCLLLLLLICVLVTFSLFVLPHPICYDSQCNLLYMQLTCVIFNCYIYFITQSGWLLAKYFLDCESNFFGLILKYTSILRSPAFKF